MFDLLMFAYGLVRKSLLKTLSSKTSSSTIISTKDLSEFEKLVDSEELSKL